MTGPTSLPALLAERARTAPGARLALRKRYGVWQPTTAAQLADRVVSVADGLRRAGVVHGTPVVVMGDASLEWLVADLAVQTVGGVSIASYPTQTAAELEAMLGGAPVPIAFCDDEVQAGVVAGLGVATIVALDPRYDLVPPADPRVRTLAAFSSTPPPDGAASWADLAAALAPGDDAVGAVTAGRSAPPRVAAFSHAAVLAAAHAGAQRLGLRPRDRTLAHVPPAQTRVLDLYAPLVAGATLGFCESGRTVEADLQELRPTVVVTVARALELLEARATQRAQASRRLKRAVTRWAHGGRHPGGSRNVVARRLVDRFVARHLGLDRTRVMAVCGVPAAPALQGFFTGIGVPVHTVYGQAESLGLVAITPGGRADGGVGAAVEGARVREGAEGELHVDGAWVADHFLDGTPCSVAGGVPTGDRGQVDERGHVYVSGAAHDLHRRPAGEHIALTRVEAQLNASPYVRRAVVVPLADGELGALVELERSVVAAWAAANGLAVADYAGLARAPEVAALVEDVRVRANAELTRAERVAAAAVLPRPLSAEPGAPIAPIAPTFAVRRGVVLDLHRALVAALEPGSDSRVADSATTP
jgi:long-chain acyl-CoA synthetase